MYVVVDESGTETRMRGLMPESARKLIEGGAFLYREAPDGSREEVTDPSEVLERAPEESVTLVMPEYVDDRMVAVVDVFDAMAAELAGARTMSADEGRPLSFPEAMARLRDIVARGVSLEG